MIKECVNKDLETYIKYTYLKNESFSKRAYDKKYLKIDSKIRRFKIQKSITEEA